MTLIFGAQNRSILNSVSKSVITIGKFDVIHLGHIEVFKEICKISSQHSLTPIVVMLHPSPQKFFNMDGDGYLYRPTLRYKIIQDVFAEYGHNPIVIMQRFNQSFASLTKDSFVNDYLKQYLKAQYLVCGENFAFGKGAGGGVGDVASAGIEVSNISCPYNFKISSSNIKNMLKLGMVKDANKICYRNIFYDGFVRRGIGLAGKNLGFKTANITLDGTKVFRPRFGVYQCNVFVDGFVDGVSYKGICNIGIKPTLGYNANIYIEAHVFGFNADIYGSRITVELVDFVRDEKKFANFDDLKNQIKLDIDFVKNKMVEDSRILIK